MYPGVVSEKSNQKEKKMLTQLFRNWWHFAARGVFAILFGVLALVWPKSAITALVLLFGAFVFVDGSVAVITSVQLRKYFKYWWALLLEGLTGIVIAVMAFVWPNVAALALLYFIASWAIITGIFEIVAALEFRNLIPGEWATFLSGLLSVIVGVILFVYPSAGAVGLMWTIAFYAIFAGIMEIIFAFRLRGLGHELSAKQTSTTRA
jgi:uncharacterized membrane protein HdeD (DUF308 family)